jgi:hypothetical protein
MTRENMMQFRATFIICAVLLFSGATLAPAASFNIDFGFPNGSTDGPPASVFGASADQPGAWNQMKSGSLLNLVDLSGTATGTQIAVTADAFNGVFAPGRTGDLGLLMNDYFYSQTSWVMTITGLANGTYDLYYYAPSHLAVDTGAFAVNGLAAPNVTGSSTGSGDVQGLDWQVVTGVTVTDGTLSAISQTGPNLFVGLSGVQIVAIPEPGSAALLAFGAGILWLRRKR